MMGARCLSEHGPCKTICEYCQASYDRYVMEQEIRAITESIRILESRGYTVTPPKKKLSDFIE